jgi:hypothetical protein
MKLSITLTALAVFGFGFRSAYLKNNQVTADQIQPAPTATSTSLESPVPVSPASTVTLQLFDRLTKAPLSGQSIVILGSVECLTPPCPASTPLVITADERGRISVSRETVQLRPKIYAAGYRLDTYFSFLDSAQPTILTLYEPIEGTKVNYDITLESIPIGLTPVKSP